MFAAPTSVGDRVRVVSGRVPRGLNRRHERVPELHHLAVSKRDMLERNADAGGQVGDRTGLLDERGETRDVVSLNGVSNTATIGAPAATAAAR